MKKKVFKLNLLNLVKVNNVTIVSIRKKNLVIYSLIDNYSSCDDSN